MNVQRKYRSRLSTAEAAIERVREYCAYLDTLAGGDRHYAAEVRRALDATPAESEQP